MQPSGADIGCESFILPACPAPGAPFQGDLFFKVKIRITDHSNSVGVAPGSGQTCRPGGSTCQLHTTLNTALGSPAVYERQRASWEVLAAEVWDPGLNLSLGGSCPPTCGDGDEKLFQRGGWFAP